MSRAPEILTALFLVDKFEGQEETRAEIVLMGDRLQEYLVLFDGLFSTLQTTHEK